MGQGPSRMDPDVIGNLQSSKAQNNGNRPLDTPFQLDIPQKNPWENSHGPVGADGDSREEVADATVQRHVAGSFRSLAP